MTVRVLPQPESEFVQQRGLRVHALHWQPPQASPSIVLLHGLASNARIWELCAPRLAAAGFDTWAIDLRGHGLSGKPKAGYNFPALRRDLDSWLRAHRLQRPLLVGHSWGAYVAVDYASHHTEGAGRPRGLVLVDGALREMASAPGASWPAVRRDLAPPRLTGLTIEQLLQRLTAPGRTWALDEHAVQAVIGNFAVDTRGRIRPHLTRQRHLALLRTIWDYRLYQAYPGLSCPVLLLPARPPAPRSAAEEQRLAEKRRGVARARKAIRDVRVRWMRDTIHDVPLQRPLALAKRILEFAASGCDA